MFLPAIASANLSFDPTFPNPPIELLITRRLSKNLKDYLSKRQLSVSAALKLEERGLESKILNSTEPMIAVFAAKWAIIVGDLSI